MAGSINVGELYNYYLNKYQDKKTAAQYAAFQFLSNPSGSVAGLKEPQKWYSQDEWYSYEAPGYLGIKNYTGDDPLNIFTSQAIKSAKNLADLQTNLRKATSKNIDLGVYDMTTNDLITQATSLWNQKEAADKKYKTQLSTHPFAQYGLPDPNLRYSVYADSNANLKAYPPGQKPNLSDPNKYVPYKPAIDYVAKSTQAFGDKIYKAGIRGEQYAKYVSQYKGALQAAVQKRLDESELSPFVQKVFELRKIRKP